MWAPVEVWEWLEDMPQPDQTIYRVWYMQMQGLAGPEAPTLRSACGLYCWGRGHRAWPLWDEDLQHLARADVWRRYTATGTVSAFGWDTAPFNHLGTQGDLYDA